MADSIGSETFITLEGSPPDDPSVQLQVITRPGVDGVSFRKLGTQPKPFVLKSYEDFSTQENARDAFKEYKALKGDSTVELVWHSVSEDYKVKVLEVMQESITAANKLLGGVNVADGSDGFVLIATWTLIFDNG